MLRVLRQVLVLVRRILCCVAGLEVGVKPVITFPGRVTKFEANLTLGLVSKRLECMLGVSMTTSTKPASATRGKSTTAGSKSSATSLSKIGLYWRSEVLCAKFLMMAVFDSCFDCKE